MTTLTKAQAEAVEKFRQLKVGALFMKMGTGKTRAAVEIINANDNVDFVLYLTPCNTKENATRELEKWGLKAPYRVVGYESIASSDRIYLETLEEVQKYQHAFIVADESIFIKRGRTKRHQRACELRKKCEYALVLNGTPIVKNEWDLYNQMKFLSEKIIPYNSYDFLEKFFVEHVIRSGSRVGRDKHWYTFYEPNRPALTKLIAPYVYEADLEFGREESEQVYWVDPTWSEVHAYEYTRDEILMSSMDADEAFIRLFGELNHQSAVTPSKNREVAEYIDGKQVICFVNYIDEVRQITEHCDCYVITGETKQKDRDRILKEFEQDGHKPLVMTMGIGGYGLNLQFCNEIVYSSLTFNYGTTEQSKYRIKRTGQERDITYTYILSRFGINDMIFQNLDRKESLADIIKELLAKGSSEKREDVLKKLL